MVEEQKDIFKEIEDAFSRHREQTSSMSKYTQDMASLGHIPDNQFDHAYGLIRPSPKDIEHDRFNFLEDQNKYLGLVKNAKELRFYQIDNFFLTMLFNMGEKDPAARIVFHVLWQNFKDELRMTCNIDGLERSYQGFNPPLQGGQARGGFLGRKKKQKFMDHVKPSDESEQGPY